MVTVQSKGHRKIAIGIAISGIPRAAHAGGAAVELVEIVVAAFVLVNTNEGAIDGNGTKGPIHGRCGNGSPAMNGSERCSFVGEFFVVLLFFVIVIVVDPNVSVIVLHDFVIVLFSLPAKRATQLLLHWI